MSFEDYDNEAGFDEEEDIDDSVHSEGIEDADEPEYDQDSLSGGKKRSSNFRQAQDINKKIKDAKDAYKRHQKIKDGKNAANNMPKSGAPTGTPGVGAGATGTGATGTAATGTAAGGGAATAGGAAAAGGGAAAAGGGSAAAGGAAGGAAVAASPVGWVIIAIIAVIVVTLLILMLFGIMTNVGEAQASVAENGMPSNITEEQRQDYKDNYETKTYTPLSNDNHFYNDEFDLRIPWAVIAEVNSRVYNGKATDKELNEIFNELKPKYTKVRPGKFYDVYTTTTITTVTKTTKDKNGKDVTTTEKIKTVDVVQKERHIIDEAETWEGTVKRDYRQEKSSNTYTEGNKTITVERVEWVYNTTTDTTYKKFREFVQDKLKEQGITVLDSEVSLMVELIESMIQQDEAFTDGEGSPDWINGYNSDLVFIGGDFGWPVDSTDVTCCFGDRHRHWDTGAVTLHNGIDVSAPMGMPVHAPKEGKVIYAAYSGMGGNTIIVDHGKDDSGKQIITEYCHLSEYKSSVGQEVKKGDVIGLIGSTGSSTGPHLHFIMKVNGTVQDPGVFFYIQVKGNSCKDRGCGNGGKYPGNNYGVYIPVPVGGGVKGSAEVEKYIKSIPDNPTDLDLLARLSIAEDSGSAMGMMAVTEVVLNKLRRYGGTVTDIITAKNQFEPVSVKDGQIIIANAGNPITKDNALYSRAQDIVKKVINENTSVAGGSVMFCANSTSGNFDYRQWEKANKACNLQFVIAYGNRYYKSVPR